MKQKNLRAASYKMDVVLFGTVEHVQNIQIHFVIMAHVIVLKKVASHLVEFAAHGQTVAEIT